MTEESALQWKLLFKKMRQCIVDLRKQVKFLFVFCAVFGYIFLTLMPLEGEPGHMVHRSKSLVPLDGVWQKVGGTLHRFYVYAAYMESRTISAIRVIAVTRTNAEDLVFCRIWLPDNRTFILQAKLRISREHFDFRFSAAYVVCVLHGSGLTPQQTVGASVAVFGLKTHSQDPTNLLIVKNTERTKIKIGKEVESLHVCVRPFHLPDKHIMWLIEWLELNRLLGVTHFYIYNERMGDHVRCLLKDYETRGLITLLPWNLPISSRRVWKKARLAAISDCLFRSMPVASWMLTIDFDEVVLPRRSSKLSDVLHDIPNSYRPDRIPEACLFRHAYFYRHWKDDPKSQVPLETSRKTRRLEEIFPYFNKTKYAVRPRAIFELGLNNVWQYVPGKITQHHLVPDNVALLHHYKARCENNIKGCLNSSSIIDRAAHRWAHELWKRVQMKQKEADNICGYTTVAVTSTT